MIKNTLLLLLAVSGLVLKAQDTAVILPAKRIVAFQPQYFINNGIRVDFDFRISEKHWIQICPQVYAADRSSSDIGNYSTLAGAGVMIYNKVFLQENSSCTGLYLNYGISYNYFGLSYLNHTTSGDENSKTLINKFGADVNLGFQRIFYNKLVVDIYTGMGIRYSTYDLSGSGTERFNHNYFDYGYTGVLLTGGFRMGILY